MKPIYTLDDLRHWRTATKKVDIPIRLGVLGDPVEHSLSPTIQNAALQHHGLKMQYARFLVPSDALEEALQLISTLDFVGVNLTVPHKRAAVPLMQEADEDAAPIGAINTISVRDGKLVGSNTDGVGFERAVRHAFSVDLRDLRVMLLGTGGAGRAIARQCALAGCARLVLVNRTHEEAIKLRDELFASFHDSRLLGPVARLEAVAWQESSIRNQLENIDMVVNATPLGLKPSDPSPLPARLLAPHMFVYDAVYGGHKTPLMLAAEEVGARAADGRLMLLHQGARSYEIWFGRAAPMNVMSAALNLTSS